MKKWNAPEINELNINETADKGYQNKSHDGNCPARRDINGICIPGCKAYVEDLAPEEVHS